jgi:hypothetical protein
MAALAAAAFAGLAFAQDTPMVFVPAWEAEPNQADYIALYPRQALAGNVSGIAVLCCTPQSDRSIDCIVSSEAPAGQGFGEASVRASRRYRMTQLSFDDFQSRSDSAIRLSVIWAAAFVSQETRDRLALVDQETIYACLPPET